jgi:hypothetical protein
MDVPATRLQADPAEAPVPGEPAEEEPIPDDPPVALPERDEPVVRPPGRRFLSFFLRLRSW